MLLPSVLTISLHFSGHFFLVNLG